MAALGKGVREMQGVISSAASVEVRAACEERNAEAVMAAVAAAHKLADKDKAIIFERLERERARDAADRELKRLGAYFQRRDFPPSVWPCSRCVPLSGALGTRLHACGFYFYRSAACTALMNCRSGVLCGSLTPVEFQNVKKLNNGRSVCVCVRVCVCTTAGGAKKAAAAAAKPAAKKGAKKKGTLKSSMDGEDEEEDDDDVAVGAALLAAQAAYQDATERANAAGERARVEGRMAEAAVTLAADVRTVAQATGAKARAAVESVAATAAAAAMQEQVEPTPLASWWLCIYGQLRCVLGSVRSPPVVVLVTLHPAHLGESVVGAGGAGVCEEDGRGGQAWV